MFSPIRLSTGFEDDTHLVQVFSYPDGSYAYTVIYFYDDSGKVVSSLRVFADGSIDER